jgi:hypothetical protein
MMIGVGILAFIAICALSLVGLGESHSRVSRIFNQLDDSRVKEDEESQAPAMMPPTQKIDALSDVFAEVGFTRSLLALSRVRSLDPYEAPALAHDESSSLVSVHRAQSKSRDRVL